MWPFFVVFLQPRFCLFTDLVQSLKHEHVEHRFAVAAIESFDKAILHRFAWFDELQSHAVLLSPISQRQRDELWSIVQSQLEWIAAMSGYLLKLAHHALGWPVKVNDHRQRL